MTNIKYFILLFITVAVVPGCDKYNSSADPYAMTTIQTTANTPAEILTAQPWRLVSYGFDNNKNGVVDINEESIRDCERDNSYTFNKDGSGIVAENAVICNGNNPVNQFAWTLLDNETVLDFYYGQANVLQLTSDKLLIANTNIADVKLLLVYGH